jgi:hypothetical protein
MPLHYPSEPAGGSSLVRAGVAEVLVRRSPLSGRGIVADEVRVDQPHAVYDLRADEIASGRGLESAHATGYRYLVNTSGGPVAAGEVVTDEHGEAKLLANLNYGNFVEETAGALAKLEVADEVQERPYEVRLLRFSSVYLMAIWLKSQTDEADIIYPLAPAPPPLEAGRSYSPDEFIRAVVPLAKRRAARQESTRVP